MFKVTSPATVQGAEAGSLAHEMIALRAYEKWRQRGCVDGHDVEDWLEAESELRREMARPARPCG